MEPVIRFDHVSKQFGKQTAINDVSYEVPRGVVFAILGENGAGKTTSIRTLLGLETPTSGNVMVLGLDSRKQGTEVRKKIGYVPEQPALYDWMTVGEIGWFTSGFYPDGFLSSYHQLVESFSLPMGKKIKSLSKGMKAQVSLSLAMAHQPELLILDEPTSGLDTLVRRRFLESMVGVAADGRTVFLSSHQITEVERVADIVAIMNEGRLLVCEPLEQLKSRLEQWTISLDAGAAQLPDTGLNLLSQEQTGRQVQLMVSHPDPESLWHLRDHPAVAEIEVHVPSLEEIFVTYLRRNEESGPARNQSGPDAGTIVGPSTERMDP